MLQFDAAWMFIVLPLPLVVWRWLPAHTDRVAAVRVPMFHRLVSLTGSAPSHGAVLRGRSLVRLLLLTAIWIATVTSLARPVWLGKPIHVERSARDLLLMVDLSESMSETDVMGTSGQPVTRLEAVKSVLKGFIDKRKGDRLGLVFFGAAPYLQVPFTPDTSVTAALLDEAQVGMAGNQTMLGDAVGLAVRLFRGSDAKHRVAILLTDGNDTGSLVPPRRAAAIAKNEHMVLHVVGFGDPENAGEQPLNEEVLTAMADTTGGAYFHAADAKRLDAIYAKLDRLEKVTFESRTYTPKRQLFYLPLGVAMGMLLLFVTALSARSGRKQWGTSHAG